VVIETPANHPDYRSRSLANFSYHTGAPLRRLAPDEPCPILFRDIGSQAMVAFLGGGLTRLAGPPSPITYMRTCDYREPYTDYERIGRLVFLQPMALHPWHSGVDTIYVADGARLCREDSIGFVPGTVALADAAARLAGARTTGDLREAFGGREYDELLHHHRAGLVSLNAEAAASERLAEPLRRRLQSRDWDDKNRARQVLEHAGLTEDDLCSAWHHVPRDRRERLCAALEENAAC
jgi:hypothetical protein